jgi:hypothetical protein
MNFDTYETQEIMLMPCVGANLHGGDAKEATDEKAAGVQYAA